jgi:hypothetical protein
MKAKIVLLNIIFNIIFSDLGSFIHAQAQTHANAKANANASVGLELAIGIGHLNRDSRLGDV